MSASGTKQTSRHVRSNVANGVKADIIGSLRISAFDPEQTLVTEIAALLVVPRNGRQPRTGWPFRCSVMLGWRIGPVADRRDHALATEDDSEQKGSVRSIPAGTSAIGLGLKRGRCRQL
jgi:hypothetical protein